MDKKTATNADITITTIVPSLRSALLGQVTDFISERTSRKKRVTFSIIAIYQLSMFVPLEREWQDRQELNPQPPVLETGALPVELLSCASILLACLFV